jgi:L-methionine (R)-S-oxide reductase
VLGPFQGQPACVRIKIGQGVCGAAAAKRETLIVPNVNEFPGHIACDSASNSEIVIPLLKNERFLGVLDLDSPMLSRFNQEDAAGLERLAQTFIDSIE